MEAELKSKSDNIIQLDENKDVLKLKIVDEKGKETGNYLEFNLADIELPLRYQKLIEEDKRARAYLNNQFTIIDRKQDHKGKKLLSSNEEEKIKALMTFYKKEEEIYNMFLGENGVKKLLNGQPLSWTSLTQIDEIIEKYIQPKLETNAQDIKNRIMEKYNKKQSDVIE